ILASIASSDLASYRIGGRRSQNLKSNQARKRTSMKKLRRILQRNRQAILDLSSRHGARNVRVFGSVVRGLESPKSDLDLLVDLDPGRSYFDLGRLNLDLQDLLRCRVDVVTSDELHWYIRDRVLAEARPL